MVYMHLNYEVDLASTQKEDLHTRCLLQAAFKGGLKAALASSVAIGLAFNSFSVNASSLALKEDNPGKTQGQKTSLSPLIAQGHQGGTFLPKPNNDQPMPHTLEGPLAPEDSREFPPFRRPFAHGVVSGGNFLGSRPLDLSVLNLTEEQKQKIQDLRTRDGLKAREFRKVLKDKRLHLRDLMFDPSSTDQEIRMERQDMRKLQNQIEELMLNDFLAIRSLLTPEQRQHFQELKPFPGSRYVSTGPNVSPDCPAAVKNAKHAKTHQIQKKESAKLGSQD
jgi:Spy/CpxP family protein refolding chaperone